MNDSNVEITNEGNILKFHNSETNCEVIYNTSDSLAYNLADFKCGSRGKGQGLQLLYYSLKYIQTQIPPRKRPFRIELLVVPSSTDESTNDFYKLKNYYKQIGFQEDEHSKSIGLDNEMYALLDRLVINIKNKLEQTAGKLKRKTNRKLYRNKNCKRTVKRINYKKSSKKNNRL